MRYKQLSLDKISDIKSLIKNVEFNVSRNSSLFETKQSIENLRSKVHELESMINIERDDYPTNSNHLV